MPSERDPRKDPKILDEVQCNGVVRRVVHVARPDSDNPDICYTVPLSYRKHYIFRSNWRKWAKGAEVIHRAD